MLELKNKKVLVTGGTGFVGRVFVSQLIEQGATVVCLTRQTRPAEQGVLYITCDFTDASTFDADQLRSTIGSVDYIVYLSASIPSVAAGKESMRAAKEHNLDPLVFFLETCGECAPTLVFASTVDIYGIPQHESFDESMNIHPESTYAVAKYCGEKYFIYYCETQQKQYTILRFSQIFGPNEPLVRVIPIMLDALIHNKPFVLSGGGQEKRKFLYVADAGRALYAALQAPHNKIYNIAGSEIVSIADVLEMAERIVGKKIQLTATPAARNPVHIIPSCDLATRELGFVSNTSFEEGLRATIASYEK